MTLNQLIKTITDLGKAHFQIKTVFYGNAFDLLSKGSDVAYPAMFFDLSGIAINNRVLTVDFQIFFADRVLLEQTNEQEVLSDQLLTAQDIVAQLRNDNFDFTIQETVPMDFFIEDTPEYIAGVSATVSLDVPYISDRCAVPSNYTFTS